MSQRRKLRRLICVVFHYFVSFVLLSSLFCDLFSCDVCCFVVFDIYVRKHLMKFDFYFFFA